MTAATNPSRIAVVAIGGNSLITDNKHPDVSHQWDAVRETSRNIADMVEVGWTTVITHGNGPQVGFILRRNELAAHEVHPTPLDLIVADTQGSIGFMLQQTLNNEFFQRKLDRQCITLITQVQVAADDPAFANPTKPIGSFMDEARAREFEREGWQVIEDAGRGWRRVVASPEPIAIVEDAAIAQAVRMGWIVVAVGGGGIPVVRNSKGELRSVYAVIDKDRASSLLATKIDADLLLISTGVEKVALNFGKPDQRFLDEMTIAEAEQYMAEGHFAPGSMKPKIEACIRFLQQSSKPDALAIITNPGNLGRALRGVTGTRIIK
ncbi:MAG: carbamate kinase [Chloroflexota bacterium]|jgi:carbamate kinase|nr:carbamate kinase [Caldilinea sp.]GIK73072.1 MAG: carbamate kinase [Chloroflexota bacterium]